MAILDTFKIQHDFFGVNDSSGAAVDVNPFVVRDISPLGAVTIAFVDGSNRGELALTMAADNEIQNLCLYQKDVLQFDIDKLTQIKFRIKTNGATMTSGSELAFGVTSERADAIDDIAEAAIFRVIGATSTTLVVVETDAGSSASNNDDVATGKTLINAYKEFIISFAVGTNDVRFFIDGEPVAESTTFDMSNYTGKLQIFCQIFKAANTNTNGAVLDYVEIRGRDSSV